MAHRLCEVCHVGDVSIAAVTRRLYFLLGNLLAFGNAERPVKAALPKMMKRPIQRWVMCFCHDYIPAAGAAPAPPGAGAAAAAGAPLWPASASASPGFGVPMFSSMLS